MAICINYSFSSTEVNYIGGVSGNVWKEDKEKDNHFTCRHLLVWYIKYIRDYLSDH